MSIESGEFPEVWKAGNIISIHKKGSKLDMDNYRPIILMSNLGKIHESVVIGNALQHILYPRRCMDLDPVGALNQLYVINWKPSNRKGTQRKRLQS